MSDLKDFVCLTSHCKCNSKCDDCSECENEIDKWLLEHDKQIKADVIDEFAKWLVTNGYIQYGFEGAYLKDKYLKELANARTNDNV